MPRSKNQKHYHWDIDDPRQLLASDSEPRRMVDTYRALHHITQPEAVADLLTAGYGQLAGIPLTERGGRGQRKGDGGAATPRTTTGRAGVAVLRPDDTRKTEQSGQPRRRPLDGGAA